MHRINVLYFYLREQSCSSTDLNCMCSSSIANGLETCVNCLVSLDPSLESQGETILSSTFIHNRSHFLYVSGLTRGFVKITNKDALDQEMSVHSL